ncbi:MAG TPA: DinB family protein [Pyrinomonadaceae bacterium]|jgi:uncharacterized damage-inducible protein DinB|nr:DinB family protein [Pyrinomonadaceae bacterium]
MSMVELLIDEFEHEAKTTRKHFERLPDEKLEWQPHEKSFTAGGLASHIVDCIGWAQPILNQDELDVDPAKLQFFSATSAADLLKTFDEKVGDCRQALARTTDEDLMKTWRLKIRGRVQVEKPKVAALRDFSLSHLIHHRGQFSGYLRLLDIPVPGSYGPSADD